MERIREEPITVYERKARLGPIAFLFSNSMWYLIRDNYKKYVENFIKNIKDGTGNPLISADEVDKLRSE